MSPQPGPDGVPAGRGGGQLGALHLHGLQRQLRDGADQGEGGVMLSDAK